MGKLDDRELLKACSLNKYTWNTVCDDAFLRMRLLSKYPQTEKYKLEDESWKRFFLRVIHFIALLKEKFDYVYTFGNFETQYDLLKEYGDAIFLIDEAAKFGELELVIWILKANPNINLDFALRMASKNGHLEVVMYLVENGADIHAQGDYALIIASENGNLEVVKFLAKVGANIHAGKDAALLYASHYGHLETVKYLVENGANIHANNDYALRLAKQNRHLEVVKYLESKM